MQQRNNRGKLLINWLGVQKWKKDEAKKALEQLNIPEEKRKRGNRVDYAALSATTFRNKKEVEQINTPKTPIATIKKAESKPKIKKIVENILTPEQTITRETRAKKIDYAALSGTTFRTLAFASARERTKK